MLCMLMYYSNTINVYTILRYWRQLRNTYTRKSYTVHRKIWPVSIYPLHSHARRHLDACTHTTLNCGQYDFYVCITHMHINFYHADNFSVSKAHRCKFVEWRAVDIFTIYDMSDYIPDSVRKVNYPMHKHCRISEICQITVFFMSHAYSVTSRI